MTSPHFLYPHPSRPDPLSALFSAVGRRKKKKTSEIGGSSWFNINLLLSSGDERKMRERETHNDGVCGEKV
jgi:hypothetical protein